MGSEFDNIVSKKDKVQDSNNMQINFQVHDTYKRDEKITTDFEPIITEDVLNKAYLDENLIKVNGDLSLLEKDYNEYKLQYNKDCGTEFVIKGKISIQLLATFSKTGFL